jgi:AraC family transcriptional regulator, regulatory protein of adaptative response / methylated-DNA-[protein]-cysteine methyltransferase
VWRGLMQIPHGTTVSYGSLAASIGKPGAARAVGAACGSNRIGVLIPCHRVIRDTGALGGYAWGLERKQALLAWESARRLRTLVSSLGG